MCLANVAVPVAIVLFRTKDKESFYKGGGLYGI